MRPEDVGRRFIISYRLADEMLSIYEPPIRNSGIIGGKFLEPTRVAKPNSTPNSPVYYGPQDFYIGARIECFGFRFIIVNADQYVLKYMEEHAHQFPGTEVLLSALMNMQNNYKIKVLDHIKLLDKHHMMF